MNSRLWITALLAAGIPIVMAQGTLKFLESSPLNYFRQNDHDLMRANAKVVLDSEEPNAKREWSNPKTGSSGVAEVRGEFVATDGAQCKRLHLKNRAGGLEGESSYAVCKYEGRGWLLHPDAKPK
jgi:hypothetical protein